MSLSGGDRIGTGNNDGDAAKVVKDVVFKSRGGGGGEKGAWEDDGVRNRGGRRVGGGE